MSLHSRWGLAPRVLRGTSARTTVVTATRSIITRISRHAVLQRFTSHLMSFISRIRRRIIPVLTRSRSNASIHLVTIPTIRYLGLGQGPIEDQITILLPIARSRLRTSWNLNARGVIYRRRKSASPHHMLPTQRMPKRRQVRRRQEILVEKLKYIDLGNQNLPARTTA
jgi:hypothetical protein